jgi:glycolate oxidase FAD binding subunit
VPCLHDGEAVVWDSLAIAVHLAERHPQMWPDERAARAWARSISAEMHSGFATLRSEMTMCIRERVDVRPWSEALAADIARVVEIWTDTRRRFGRVGPYLMGDFSLADVFYAPVAFRFQTYEVEPAGVAGEYLDALLAHPFVREWESDALVGDPLDVREVTGVVSYAPGELVLTARSGTRLAEIEDVLAAHGQMLAFEPPHHGEGATLGGVIASGFSGPRRPHAGAARDFVLGTRVIDGTGTALTFGGQLIKNVAGFDVSRLMTGALGTLGVITEISLKCLPRPKVETTRVVQCDAARALALMNEWGGKALPISATCFHDNLLHVRLSGAPPAIAAAVPIIGGDEVDGASFWRALRDQTLDFFRPAIAGDAMLWRLCVRSTSPATPWLADTLVEWGGALRWLVAGTPLDADALRAWASEHGGHATLFRGNDKSAGSFQPLPAPMLALHERLKQVFDPHRILNPGRMYASL